MMSKIYFMRKSFIAIIFFLLSVSFAKAGYEGSGPLKLSPTVVKYFKEYLDTKDHNTGEGADRHGRGWFFFVAESGEEFGYTYCPSGKTCIMDQVHAKKLCVKNVKKYLKRKEKCYLFAKQRTIQWDGKKIRLDKDASSSEIEGILRNLGFID